MSENTNTSNHHLEEKLFTEFPKPTAQEWRDVVEKSLKGATIEEKLVTRTYEKIDLQPMYREEDIEGFPYLETKPGEFPFVRGTKKQGYLDKPWDICQDIDSSTPEEFNQIARYDLDRGQTMLKLFLYESDEINIHQANKRKGLLISSVNDFRKAFQNINLEEVPFYIETANGGKAFFASFVAYIQQQNYDFKKIKGCFGMDPLSDLVKEGSLSYSLNDTYEMMAEMTKWSIKNTPNLRTLFVQTHPYHDAGGNVIHELAFAISSGLEYLREMDHRDLSIDDAANKMIFSFSIGSNFFMEIAKLRAARMLWARIIKELGGNEAAQKMTIHSRTSAWTKTKYDPYVNILRGTVEAFAGVIGGTDSLQVSPFDEAIKTSDEFSRRIARNTHLILDKESNLSKVTDPAGGSWYIESLTYTIAEKAWELFQKVEENGGMFKALQIGLPQELIAQVSEEKTANIKNRKDKFIGTNIYPNLLETPLKTKALNQEEDVDQKSTTDDVKTNLAHLKELENLSMEDAIDAANNGASITELKKMMNYSTSTRPKIRPLMINRGAKPYEILRQFSEAYKHKNGEFPTVFVANYGPVAKYKARTDFVTDFFEVGGFKVLQNKGFDSITEVIDLFNQSGSTIAVICSTDDQYPEIVPILTKQFKLKNPKVNVLLAGKPVIEEMNLYKQLGVNDFIHMHVNNYDKLENLQLDGGFRK